MGERVHPSVEGSPPHYPSVPSYQQHAHDQYQHDIQIPGKVIHKEEQQQSLISNHQVGSNGGFKNEDTIDVAQQRPARRRHRRCMRCCCCAGACVGTIVLVLGILVLVLFLVLHPKLPKYTISQASISTFSISNSSSTASTTIAVSSIQEAEEETYYLNANMELVVRARNPNKRIGIDYRGIEAKLYYEGVEIGEGSIPPFYQGHRNTTYVGLAMQGRDIALTPSLGAALRASLENDDSLTLNARAITHVRVKIGHWKSHASKVRVKCSVEISNPARGSVRLLHTSCKFKLLRLRL